MKNVVGCGLWVVGLFIFSFFLYTGCWAEQSDSYSWDFGQVKQGEIAVHDFTFKNDSGRVLNIKSTSTSCGCTVSEAGKKVLAPGESTKISVKFNSKKYSGHVQQFVYVNTDQADNPIIKLTIKANVVV